MAICTNKTKLDHLEEYLKTCEVFDFQDLVMYNEEILNFGLILDMKNQTVCFYMSELIVEECHKL